MKKIFAVLMAFALVLNFSGCGFFEQEESEKVQENPTFGEEQVQKEKPEVPVSIVFSDEGITVDGEPAEKSEFVSVGGEIIYYHDLDAYESENPYGEGEKSDRHSQEEAAKHGLLTVKKAGKYVLSGDFLGQVAVDLGEDAKDDPDAVVTLVFDGVNINCEIAPAVIFYNVYECGDDEHQQKEVDTSKAGARVIIADGSVNNIKGANVAKIYKDNDEHEKLHKYDGAFYSCMSLSIDGEDKKDGVLNIEGTNEGLCSEMHLTINGGIINISSQNDGINTNEDETSVVTINGGEVTVKGGLGAEGDGIDSNGWIVINGGTVLAFSNGRTGDGGIDADMGIYINGGSVAAFGSRNDDVRGGEQTFVQLNFASVRSAGSVVEFVDENGYGMIAESDREFLSVTFSGKNLEKNKAYRVYVNDILQEYSGNQNPAVPEDFGGFRGDFGRKENPYEAPEGFSEWLESAEDIPEEIREWLIYMESVSDELGRSGFERPEGKLPFEEPKQPEKTENKGSGSVITLQEVYPTEFVITDEGWSFYGLSDSAQEAGKTRVDFTVDEEKYIYDFYEGENPGIKSIECSEKIDKKDVQITLSYIGEEEDITVYEICLLYDGYEKINGLFDGLLAGEYRLTVAVLAENEEYTGSDSFDFVVKKAK